MEKQCCENCLRFEEYTDEWKHKTNHDGVCDKDCIGDIWDEINVNFENYCEKWVKNPCFECGESCSNCCE